MKVSQIFLDIKGSLQLFDTVQFGTTTQRENSCIMSSVVLEELSEVKKNLCLTENLHYKLKVWGLKEDGHWEGLLNCIVGVIGSCVFKGRPPSRLLLLWLWTLLFNLSLVSPPLDKCNNKTKKCSLRRISRIKVQTLVVSSTPTDATEHKRVCLELDFVFPTLPPWI